MEIRITMAENGYWNVHTNSHFLNNKCSWVPKQSGSDVQGNFETLTAAIRCLATNKETAWIVHS